MIRDTLVEDVVIYRPKTEQNTSATRTYTRGIAKSVKVSQSASASVDTTGVVRQRATTIFFNFGISHIEAVDEQFDEAFHAGDVLSFAEVRRTPPTDKFVVKSVTLHRFRGKKHHLEVVCV